MTLVSKIYILSAFPFYEYSEKISDTDCVQLVVSVECLIRSELVLPDYALPVLEPLRGFFHREGCPYEPVQVAERL